MSIELAFRGEAGGLVDEQTVVIVGGGPVGLALAVELGSRGVPVQLFDNTDGSVLFPAGEAIFSRTMEHLRRWGIVQQARVEGSPPIDYPHRIVFMTTVTGHLLTAFDNGATNAEPGYFQPFTPEGPAFLSKFSFLPLLQRAAAAMPNVHISYHHEVTNFTQSDERATVSVRDLRDGSTRTVDASYLVGCDGGRSFVRRELGIAFAGDFAQGENFAVHFRAPQLQELLKANAGGLAAQIQTLASASRPYITVVNGSDEWRLSVYLDGEPSPDSAVRWVHEAVGAEIDIEILRAQPWSGHRVVADRYRDGRVFLAGDAAHLLWPKGGFGANTGIGDAVDLGWKLAAVLSGWAGVSLLDSYEVERRPIAVRNVSEASSNWTSDSQIAPNPALDREDQVGVDARQRMGELINTLRGREFLSIGVQLGYRYRDSPVILVDGTPEPPDEPDDYVPSTWPGSRAPHVWLDDTSSILDRFGAGFVLVDAHGDSGGGEDSFVSVAAERGIPLEIVWLTPEAAAGLYSTRFTLVRPDGHVCWRGEQIPPDAGLLLDVVCGRTTVAHTAVSVPA